MQEQSFIHSLLSLKDRLYRLALGITQNRQEAEDVVQDTLLRMWNKRTEWHRIASPEAYCLTTARNLALDRTARQTEDALDENPENEPATAFADTPQGHMEQHEQWALVQRLMKQLPPLQRQVMHLRDVEGMSYKQIADLTGHSEEQVKSALFRARQKVRQLYLEIERYGL